jgi:hypothetical protein
MNTRLVIAINLAAIFCMVGCSSEPTSDQFKAFADQYATKISGEKTSDNGDLRIVKAELSKFNLEKTNSLTVPFIGTAEYTIEIDGLTVRSTKIKGYTTPAKCFNQASVKFGWIDGEWQPQEGEVFISAVDYPQLAMEDKAKLLNLYDKSVMYPIEAGDIAKGEVWALNRNLTMNEKEFDELYLKPARESAEAQQKAKAELDAFRAKINPN